MSIMPGQAWRDNGHKALCPLSAHVIGATPHVAEVAIPYVMVATVHPALALGQLSSHRRQNDRPVAPVLCAMNEEGVLNVSERVFKKIYRYFA